MILLGAHAQELYQRFIFLEFISRATSNILYFTRTRLLAKHEAAKSLINYKNNVSSFWDMDGEVHW